MGLLTPSKENIEVDGIIFFIIMNNKNNWLRNITLVPQEICTYDSTISENTITLNML